MIAVKRILFYLTGTLNYGCFYAHGGTTRLKMIGYTDSDLAADVDMSQRHLVSWEQAGVLAPEAADGRSVFM